MKLATAGNKENIQKLVNQYFYTTNYIIDDNNNIIHSQTGKCLDNFKILNVKRNVGYFLIMYNRLIGGY